MLQDVFLFSGTIRSNILLRKEDVTDEEVARVQHLLNTRPRKTLGWKTPQEAYSEYLREVEEGALTT